MSKGDGKHWMEVDVDYWMTGVELGQIRGRLIRELIDLMDRKYQEEKWIYDHDGSFYNEISFPFEMLDDLSLFSAIDNNTIPYDKIGTVYKSRKEVDEVMKLARSFYHFANLDDPPETNEEYLTAPELQELRELSLEAFLVFMENEKENEEFCKFILELITNERCQELKTEGRSAYDAILEYTTICRKYNNAKS